MKEKLLQDIKGRRTLVITIMVSFLSIVTLALTIYMVNDTMSFHQKGFSNEVEYKEGIIFIVKLISWIIIAFLVLFGPYLYLLNRMFLRYLNSIRELDSADTSFMTETIYSTDFLYRYWPRIILKENSVTFFSIFKDTMIPFNQITKIIAHDVYFRGYSGLVKITSYHAQLNYLFKSRNLVNAFLRRASEINPNIIITRN